MEKKKSKAWLVVLIVFAVLLMEIVPSVLLGILSDQISGGDAIKRQEDTYQRVNYTELTRNQRLEDFDYFFEMLKTTLPYVYDMEEKFGFSVLDREEEYRRLVWECPDDYAFFALMYSIINDIPSGHASFAPPDYYSYFSSGYYRTDTVGLNLTDNLRGKLDAYGQYLVTKQHEYDRKTEDALMFTYADGTYLCTGASGAEFHSVITEINGGDPGKFIANMLSPTGKLLYDPKYECAYRPYVVFSTVGTQPVTLSLTLQDGTECDVVVYTDYDIVFSWYNGGYFATDYYNYEGEEFEAAPDADETAVGIQTDDSIDLAYVQLSSLLYSDGSVVEEKLREINDYDTIVIDLRGNGGGVSSFYESYIYPALYKEDASFEAVGYVPKNSYTKGLFNGLIGGALNRLVNGLRFGVTDEYPPEMYDCSNGEYYKYSFKHKLSGDSSLSYSDNRSVYYIVNNNTCSAADEIVQMVKECDLGTVVGTHTLGEGLVFGVCCDWLPNSLLMYYYCPTYAIDKEGVNNNLYGTMPDIYGGTSLEGYILSDEMELTGQDWTTLENRELWDNNYRIILGEIGALDMAA